MYVAARRVGDEGLPRGTKMNHAIQILVTLLEQEYREIWGRGERALRLALCPAAMSDLEEAGGSKPTYVSFPQEPDVSVPLVESDEVELFAFETERRRGVECRCGMGGEDGLCRPRIRLAKRDGTWEGE